jgi:hypothetical protein
VTAFDEQRAARSSAETAINELHELEPETRAAAVAALVEWLRVRSAASIGTLAQSIVGELIDGAWGVLENDKWGRTQFSHACSAWFGVVPGSRPAGMLGTIDQLIDALSREIASVERRGGTPAIEAWSTRAFADAAISQAVASCRADSAWSVEDDRWIADLIVSLQRMQLTGQQMTRDALAHHVSATFVLPQ